MQVQAFVLSPDQREPALNVLGTQVTCAGVQRRDAKLRHHGAAG
jgi:hypothetical protein